jgi:putative YphP/YqiW family bacilliredoxin
VGLLHNGKLVFMLQRSDIENHDARQIADRLTAAFDQFCGTTTKA